MDVSIKHASHELAPVHMKSRGCVTLIECLNVQSGLESNQPEPHVFIPFCVFLPKTIGSPVELSSKKYKIIHSKTFGNCK